MSREAWGWSARLGRRHVVVKTLARRWPPFGLQRSPLFSRQGMERYGSCQLWMQQNGFTPLLVLSPQLWGIGQDHWFGKSDCIVVPDKDASIALSRQAIRMRSSPNHTHGVQALLRVRHVRRLTSAAYGRPAQMGSLFPRSILSRRNAEKRFRPGTHRL